MDNITCIFNTIFVDLLNCKIGMDDEIYYNTNFDAEIIHSQILKKIKIGCLCLPPNVVILEPAGTPT